MSYPMYATFELKLQNKTFDKIKSFATIEPGWHYGRGVAAVRGQIVMAMKICDNYLMSKFNATDAFLGAEGEIAVTAYYKNHYIETITKPDGTFDFIYDVADDEILRREGLTEAEAFSTLREVKSSIWPGSDLSILATMIRARGRSTALHSKILPIMVGPPSYAKPAWTLAEPQFVNILQISTKKGLPEPLQYSGKYLNMTFPQVAS